MPIHLASRDLRIRRKDAARPLQGHLEKLRERGKEYNGRERRQWGEKHDWARRKGAALTRRYRGEAGHGRPAPFLIAALLRSVKNCLVASRMSTRVPQFHQNRRGGRHGGWVRCSDHRRGP